MKPTVLLLLLGIYNPLMAQTPDLSTVTNLKSLIATTQNGEKLMWMDSLSNTVKYQTEFNYESIVRETISYAKTLDSIDLAGYRTTDLIYYNNSVIGKPDVGIQLFNDFIAAYPNYNKSSVLSRLYLNVADSYYYTGAPNKSIDYYKKSGNYAAETNDMGMMALAKMYIGYTHSDLGQFSLASIDLKEAADHFRAIKDTFNLIGAKTGIAIQYSQVNFLEEANAEREEAIVLSKLSNNYLSLVSLYYNNATDFRFLGKTQERIDNIKEAIAIAKKANISREMEHLLYTNLVVAYVEHKDILNAEATFKKVLTYEDLQYEGKSMESFMEAKMWLEYYYGNYKEAIALAETYLDLKQKRSVYAEILETHKFLNMVYEASGNTSKAYSSLEDYIHLKDSIGNSKNIKSLAFYQTLYETEKRDSKIKTQQSDIALLNEQNKQKNQFILLGSFGLLSLFALILMIRSRNKAKQRHALQEQFSRDLLQSQEKERTRIAKDLHDSVGQHLTLIKQKSLQVQQDEISDLTSNALNEVRSISRGLYPALLKQLGLTASIEQLIKDFDANKEVSFTTEIVTIDTFFNDEDGLNFYRFVQECLTNTVKHADATSVYVSTAVHDKELLFVLEDDGKGFNATDKQKQASLGLKTLDERIRILKGSLNINSVIGQGTTITAKTPLRIMC